MAKPRINVSVYGHREADSRPEYVHGTMDITEQQKTFDGLVKISAIFVVHALLILALLAIFAT